MNKILKVQSMLSDECAHEGAVMSGWPCSPPLGQSGCSLSRGRAHSTYCQDPTVAAEFKMGMILVYMFQTSSVCTYEQAGLLHVTSFIDGIICSRVFCCSTAAIGFVTDMSSSNRVDTKEKGL